MTDEQDLAEELDDDELEGPYPPDTLLGTPDAVSEAGTDPGAPESVAERAYREEPDFGEEGSERPSSTANTPAAGSGSLGDRTLSDVVQEREAPTPAEVAAINVAEENRGVFTSDVDDPDLDAAHDIDPDVQR